MHSGEPIRADDNVKYLLKTEIMFRRINTNDIPPSLLNSYENLKEYKEMVRVYAKSEKAFDNGEVEDFVK